MSALSQPFEIGGVRLRNRIMAAPMCTYSAGPDGMATDWHFAHYGRMAMGGAGLVMLEATGISVVGRKCYTDLGIWSDDHVAPLGRIAGFIRAQGAVPAIQLQHAGRKSSARPPWDGAGPLDDSDAARGQHPWRAVGPSAVPVGPGHPVPAEIALAEMPAVIAEWVAATRRAVAAGFEVIEVHAAHGYLLNQFLSPLANRRTDAYGGSLGNRMRFPLEVIAAVRAAMPAGMPLFVRVSAIDGVEGGWTLADSVVFAREMKARGVDVVDCSSGGIGGTATNSRLARTPGFQVPMAEAIRHGAGVPTVAVGLILTPEDAEAVLAGGKADIVALGRPFLVDPNWANNALTQLDPQQGYAHWPQNMGYWLERRASVLRSHDEEEREQAKAARR